MALVVKNPAYTLLERGIAKFELLALIQITYVQLSNTHIIFCSRESNVVLR